MQIDCNLGIIKLLKHYMHSNIKLLQIFIVIFLFISCQKTESSNSSTNTINSLPIAPSGLTLVLNVNNKILLS